MNLLGLAGGTVRPPLVPFSAEQKARLKALMEKLGIFPPAQEVHARL
jgi:dihydrodipicolinate synthase/N-acetylneuraminate lyase